MKSTRKRYLALLLALILLLTSFAGCGKKTKSAKTDDTSAYEARERGFRNASAA